SELGLTLALKLQVIEELQEHDPGEHRQAVKVVVQAFIFSYDVFGGLEKRSERLGGGGNGSGFWHGQSYVAQASPPASFGGVPPPEGMVGVIAASVPRTGTVPELAAADGCVTPD